VKEEGEAPPRRASVWQNGGGGSRTDDRERRGVGRGVVRVLSSAQSQQGILCMHVKEQHCACHAVAARMQWRHACPYTC